MYISTHFSFPFSDVLFFLWALLPHYNILEASALSKILINSIIWKKGFLVAWRKWLTVKSNNENDEVLDIKRTINPLWKEKGFCSWNFVYNPWMTIKCLTCYRTLNSLVWVKYFQLCPIFIFQSCITGCCFMRRWAQSSVGMAAKLVSYESDSSFQVAAKTQQSLSLVIN